MRKWICILLAAALLAGCTPTPSVDITQVSVDTSEQVSGQQTTEPTASATVPEQLDLTQQFSDRDFRTEYDAGKSVAVTLEGNTARSDAKAVQISGSTVTLSDEGVYVFTGSLEDGMIVIDAEKTDKLQLVLCGVTVHSQTCAPIYVRQADKVFVTLVENTVNTLSNGGSFAPVDDSNIDAVIFSKEDITFNGSGGLNITSPAGHGIVSKDSLRITGGAFVIESASHGVAGKDDVSIADASMRITAGKDGIHAENNDNAAYGYVCIQKGSFIIDAQGDGISAAALMQIEGGSFEIVTGGGSVNGQKQSSDNWGGFGGMGGGRPGGKGDKGGFGSSGSATETDSTSIKGLKAGQQLLITGGTFVMDTADDAIHSNGSLTVNGGRFTLSSGDDGIHAEEKLNIYAGAVTITESYEGLEALHILVSGGDISLVATDDGLNAAGGTDESGFGGRDNGMFGGGGRPGGMGGFGGGMGSGSKGSIVISGGDLAINASGDGIDANGTLEITGGHTVVCGPTRGDTATLDYDTSAVITGGTFLGTGASGMAQTFSDSQQGVIAAQVGGAAAGTKITVTDAQGNTVLTHTPGLAFAVVILSSPELVKGQTYTLQVGDISGEMTAD